MSTTKLTSKGLLIYCLFSLFIISIPVIALAGTSVETSYGDLTLNAYIQGQYRHFFEDGLVSTFRVPKARLLFGGMLLDDWFGGLVQIDVARGDLLLDAYIDAYLIKDTLSFRLGQYRVPFGMEMMMPTSKLFFIERSLVNNAIVPNRDLGLTGTYKTTFPNPNMWLEFDAGVFNGAGRNTLDNNDEKDFAVSVSANPFPMDLFSGFELRFNYYFGFEDYDGDGNVDENRKLLGGGAGFDHPMFFFQGEYIQGEYEEAHLHPNPFEQRAEETFGYYAYGGFRWNLDKFRIETIEPVVRYQLYEPDKSADDDRTTVVTGGVNFYFDGHFAKLMLNYDHVMEEVTTVENDVFTAQMQLMY